METIIRPLNISQGLHLLFEQLPCGWFPLTAIVTSFYATQQPLVIGQVDLKQGEVAWITKRVLKVGLLDSHGSN